MTINRALIDLCRISLVVFFLVFAPVQIVLMVFLLVLWAGALVGGIYVLFYEPGEQERSATQLVAELPLSLARSAHALRKQPSGFAREWAERLLGIAFEHYEVALQRMAEGKFDDAELAAKSASYSLCLVCELLQLDGAFARSADNVVIDVT